MILSSILRAERVINMKKTTLQLDTITCPSCVRRIEGTLGKQTGVKTAVVKFNASKVEVEYDEELITAEAVAGFVSKLGYKVLNIK